VKGDLVAEHDPVLDGREDLFEAVVIPKALPRPKPAEPKEQENEQPDAGPFDPADHSVPEVLDYLETASLEEAERVLQAESEGKARTTVLHPGGPLLARKEQESKEAGQ
ncbi:hypothetical protein, partial [Micromonospora parva]|uniref:hypothetical protein n=1 Tax=Micromonospora parva TaxID=1464048 RepID=UPI003662E3EA